VLVLPFVQCYLDQICDVIVDSTCSVCDYFFGMREIKKTDSECTTEYEDNLKAPKNSSENNLLQEYGSLDGEQLIQKLSSLGISEYGMDKDGNLIILRLDQDISQNDFNDLSVTGAKYLVSTDSCTYKINRSFSSFTKKKFPLEKCNKSENNQVAQDSFKVSTDELVIAGLDTCSALTFSNKGRNYLLHADATTSPEKIARSIKSNFDTDLLKADESFKIYIWKGANLLGGVPGVSDMYAKNNILSALKELNLDNKVQDLGEAIYMDTVGVSDKGPCKSDFIAESMGLDD